MNPRRIIFNALAVLALTAGVVSISNAQVQRTFVSVTGSDANVATNCNVTAPCRTFNTAQTVTNTGGEIVAITSGGYGPTTITKGITLIGTGLSVAISTPAGADGVTVNVAPGDAGNRRVVLRDLRIQGLGLGDNGVQVDNVGSLYLQGVTVERFNGNGIHWETGGPAGPGGGRLIISDCTVRENDGDGLFVDANDRTRVSIDDSRFVRNGDDGVDLDDGNIDCSISDSVLSENGYEQDEPLGKIANGEAAFVNAAFGSPLQLEIGGSGNGLECDAGNGTEVAVTRTTAAHNDGDGYYISAGQLSIEYSTAHRNGDDGYEVQGALVAAESKFPELRNFRQSHHAMLQAAPPVIRVALSLSTNNKGCGFSQQGDGIFERPATQGNMVRGNGAGDTGNGCGVVTTFAPI